MSMISIDQLAEYTNTVSEKEIVQVYVDAAQDVVEAYLGYLLSTKYEGSQLPDLPGIIKLTILRIAALMQTECDGNIGITSKSFGDSGNNRTFVRTTDYDPYLQQISNYRGA